MNFKHFLLFSFCFFSIFPDFSVPIAEWGRDSKMHESHRKMTTLNLDTTRVTQLSWHPRAFLYRGFLSDEECDHLISLARGKLKRAKVSDEYGHSKLSEVRTSHGKFLRKGQDEIVANIEARIAMWTFLPEENGEDIQILHYENGQKYDPHYDVFSDETNKELGGHRVATVLMYLSNVEKGGETTFPDSESKMSQPKDDNFSDCGKSGYAVKPKKGDALLFFSLEPDGSPDPDSLHRSCPVIDGEKWSATKWIHVRPFEEKLQQPVIHMHCKDEHVHCRLWARTGECEKNPLYMVGSDNSLGQCRKSCNVCSY